MKLSLDVIISIVSTGPEMLVTLLSKAEVKIPSSKLPQVLMSNEDVSNKF